VIPADVALSRSFPCRAVARAPIDTATVSLPPRPDPGPRGFFKPPTTAARPAQARARPGRGAGLDWWWCRIMANDPFSPPGPTRNLRCARAGPTPSARSPAASTRAGAVPTSFSWGGSSCTGGREADVPSYVGLACPAPPPWSPPGTVARPAVHLATPQARRPDLIPPPPVSESARPPRRISLVEMVQACSQPRPAADTVEDLRASSGPVRPR